MKEEGYFFKLSRFHKKIENHIKNNPEFLYPEERRKEILARLRAEPCKDLSISRPNEGWGIEVPDDSKHVIYTWFDALINYKSVASTSKTKNLWPCDMHIIGKDILWFHAVIWPAMLMSSSEELPKQIYVHGMLLGSDGRKMSKSLGNATSPDELFSRFSGDLIRYALMRGVPSGADGSVRLEDFETKNNSELANDLGNLVSRVTKLYAKNFETQIEDFLKPIE